MIIQGDALTVLSGMAADSVDCCVTSPPYWGLRDYGIDGIVWGGNRGCEHEWAETKHTDTRGTQGTGLAGRDPYNGGENRLNYEHAFCSVCGAWRGQLGLEPTFELYIEHLVSIFDQVKRVLKKTGTCWVNLGDSYAAGGGEAVKKSLKRQSAIDTGSYPDYPPSAKLRSKMGKSLILIPHRFSIAMLERSWICRNVLIWHKPNCMPSSAKDRFTVDFEYVFFFTKSKSYYFEQLFEDHSRDWGEEGWAKHGCKEPEKSKKLKMATRGVVERGAVQNPEGRNRRCVWKVPTQPYSEAHFAVYPRALIEPMIRAGCPRGGTVLDPFAGSCTTGEEAISQGKEFIGIEINPEYIELAERRTAETQVELPL